MRRIDFKRLRNRLNKKACSFPNYTKQSKLNLYQNTNLNKVSLILECSRLKNIITHLYLTESKVVTWTVSKDRTLTDISSVHIILQVALF